MKDIFGKKMSKGEARNRLRQARALETPECLTPNEVDQAVNRPEVLRPERRKHLEGCHLCKATVAAAS